MGRYSVTDRNSFIVDNRATNSYPQHRDEVHLGESSEDLAIDLNSMDSGEGRFIQHLNSQMQADKDARPQAIYVEDVKTNPR